MLLRNNWARALTGVACLLALAAATTTTATTTTASGGAPLLEVSGFSWVENLVFDGHGSLWASEATSGQLWRVHLAEDGASWHKSLVVDGLRHVDGLVVSDDGSTLYAIAQTHEQAQGGGTAMVVSVPTDPTALSSSSTPHQLGNFSVVVHTPELPNGMKRNLVTNKFYLTVEGREFLPGQGKVYELDTTTGALTVIMEGLYWSDGIAIDHPRQLLYVGELLTGHVYVYNMTSKQALGLFKSGLDAEKFQWLDDFFVDADCSSIVGAAYSEGKIVRFATAFDDSGSPVPSNNSNVTVLASGLQTPTAVLWGPQGPGAAAAGFRATSLYVTEGGGFTPKVTDRRIVEVPNMRAAPPNSSACWTYMVGQG